MVRDFEGLHFDFYAFTLQPIFQEPVAQTLCKLTKFCGSRAMIGVDHNFSLLEVSHARDVAKPRRSQGFVAVREPEQQARVFQYLRGAV